MTGKNRNRRKFRAWQGLCEAMEGRVHLSASLIKDLNQVPDADLSQAVGYNGAFYFVASDPTHGFELWKSDGTAAGTGMLADVNPGAASSSISGLAVANGLLYFAANDGSHGLELWATDGTGGGTALVKDIYPGAESSSPATPVAYGGQLYFAAATPTQGREVWRSNGTTAGTTIAIDVQPGVGDSNPDHLAVAGSKLYFTAIQGSRSYLWSSNGTSVGNVKLTPDVFEITPVGNKVFFTNSSNGLSVTDGTLVGTQAVTGVGQTAGMEITDVNGVAIFSGNDGVHGWELWRSDGTAGGTTMVKDIDAGSGDGFGGGLASAGGWAYFVAEKDSASTLWQSDGTDAGTRQVTGALGDTFYWPNTITAAGGLVYFDGGTGMWRTNGTVGGTFEVADVGADVPFGVTVAGAKTFFMGRDGGGSVWVTDGTEAGTSRAAAVQLPDGDDDAAEYTAVGGTTFFVGSDGVHGQELWKTDGTGAGTAMVKDINPSVGSYPMSLANLNGTLLFFANNGSNGFELWRSNGTAAGTQMVKDVYAGSGSSTGFGVPMLVVGNVAYFAATDGIVGMELWKTDGTAAGTVRVADVRAGATGSNPMNFMTAGGVLYFTADDGVHGRELWRSNGTAAGTSLVADMTAGAGSTSFPPRDNEAALGSLLVFTANDGVHGWEPWVTDGTQAGTVLLGDINPGAGSSASSFSTPMIAYNGRAYFGANNGTGRVQLWGTDGTPGGTSLVFTIAPSGSSESIDGFTVLNGRLIFENFTTGGSGIWSTDGTPDGTLSVLAPTLTGPLWMGDAGHVAFGGKVYFWAADALHGWEVWSTDATAAGTTLVADVRVGTEDSLMQGLYTGMVVNGNQMFFTASDGMAGREMWAITLPAAAVAPATVAEGGVVTLGGVPAGTVTDPLDPVIYTWDLDGDGVFGETGAAATRGEEVGASPVFSAAGLDGPTTVGVTVRATNSSGTNVASGTVAVANAVPVVTIDAVPTDGVEGSGIHLSGSATDASTADLVAGGQLAWTVKRGTVVVATGVGASIDFVPPDSGTYSVTLVATDKDGGSASATSALAVGNVAPFGTFGDATAVARVPVTLTLAGGSDASAADVTAGLLYSFDLDGDAQGTFETGESASASTVVTFMTAGAHTVRARVRDKDGGASVYTATVVVSLPEGPVATFAGGGAVDEGTAGAVGFTAPVGAGPFTYSYDFDDAGAFEVAGTGAATAVVPAGYLADGPFVRTVRGRVTDFFGQSTDYTADIVVRNVAPTFLIPAAANGSVVLGTGYTLSLAAADPGQDGVTSWRVAWGDQQSSDLQGAAGLLGHAYGAAGQYVVTVTANDGDGSYQETRSIKVTAETPMAAFGAGAAVVTGGTYRFTVTYGDDLGIDTGSLGDGDLDVTGPAGRAGVRLVSFANGANAGSVVATYEATSPAGGAWSWQDSGTYSVGVRGNEVRDLQGLFAPAGALGSFAVALVPPAQAPDLVGAFMGAVPKALVPGGKNVVTVKVSNRGNAGVPAAGKVVTRLYLSADGVVGEGDVLLGSATSAGSFALNGSKVATFNFASPKVGVGGKYYLLAQVDATGVVAERDERNNVAAAGVSVAASAVDLATTTFATKPKGKYKAGETVSVGLRVANAGTADAAGSAVVRFYFSTNPVLGGESQPVYTSSLSVKLKAKASAVFNRSFKIPGKMGVGKWYLIAVTDGGAVGDVNAKNNTASGVFQV